jgi:hypothetical protein
VFCRALSAVRAAAMMLFGNWIQLRPRFLVGVGEYALQGLLRVTACRRACHSADGFVEHAYLQLDTPASRFAFAAGALDADIAGVDRIALGTECGDQAGKLALDVPVTADVGESEA